MRWIAFWMLLSGAWLTAGPAGAVVLSGTVTRTDDGAPVDGAMILVRGTGLYVQTNSEGVFSLPTVPAGIYGLSCSAPGLVGQSSGAVDLSADASHDFSLQTPAAETVSVTGTVLCAGSGCAGTLIQARQDGRVQARAISGPGGVFAIEGLAEGNYDVRGIRLGHLVDERLGVAVAAAAPPTVDLDLPQAAATFTLSGRVGLSDNPLDKSGSAVQVYGQQPDLATATDTGGSYRLAQVPAGLLSVAAAHTGYDGHQRLDVLVQADRSLDFVLTVQGGNGGQPTYRVSGVVRLADPAGGDPQPAAGCRVSLWRTDADWRRSASTDADGRYAIDGAAAGSYQAAAAREGYFDQVAEPFDLAANLSRDFELEPDPDYDWGPGADDGEMGCASAAGPTTGGTGLALLLAAAIGLGRRRRR